MRGSGAVLALSENGSLCLSSSLVCCEKCECSQRVRSLCWTAANCLATVSPLKELDQRGFTHTAGNWRRGMCYQTCTQLYSAAVWFIYTLLKCTHRRPTVVLQDPKRHSGNVILNVLETYHPWHHLMLIYGQILTELHNCTLDFLCNIWD